MTLPRRKMSELVTLYKLNKSVRDVIVEGKFDQWLYVRLFSDKLPTGSAIYAESDIDIDLYPAVGEGCKARLIKLCTYLFNVDVKGLHGIVDSDLDEWCMAGLNAPLVAYTHFTSIEFHFADIERLRRVLLNFFQKEIQDSHFEKALRISKILYSVRVLGERSKKPYGFPNIGSSIFGRVDAEFSLKDFLVRVDSRNKTGAFYVENIDQINKIYNELPDDFPKVINFHDLEEVFGCMLRQKYNVRDHVDVLGWLSRLVTLDDAAVRRDLSPVSKIEQYLAS